MDRGNFLLLRPVLNVIRPVLRVVTLFVLFCSFLVYISLLFFSVRGGYHVKIESEKIGAGGLLETNPACKIVLGHFQNIEKFEKFEKKQENKSTRKEKKEEGAAALDRP